MNLRSRVKSLEKQERATSKPPIRLIVGCAGKPFDWAGAACTRTLWRDGTLFECVHFNGTTAGVNKEDLERFIAKFPIEALE